VNFSIFNAGGGCSAVSAQRDRIADSCEFPRKGGSLASVVFLSAWPNADASRLRCSCRHQAGECGMARHGVHAGQFIPAPGKAIKAGLVFILPAAWPSGRMPTTTRVCAAAGEPLLQDATDNGWILPHLARVDARAASTPELAPGECNHQKAKRRLLSSCNSLAIGGVESRHAMQRDTEEGCKAPVGDLAKVSRSSARPDRFYLPAAWPCEVANASSSIHDHARVRGGRPPFIFPALERGRSASDSSTHRSGNSSSLALCPCHGPQDARAPLF
jgi:hypothetical protein